jgi:signal transduction histidine kinase
MAIRLPACDSPPDESDADPVPITPRAVAAIKEQARALETALRNGCGIDPIKVAGHAMDRRGVPLLRAILAFAVLGILYVDPGLDPHPSLVSAALALYTLYAVLVYVLAMASLPLQRRLAPWIDVAWYTLLMSLSQGTSRLFVLFYFFAILVASFRSGRAEGLRITAVSAAMILAVEVVAPTPNRFVLNLLLRPLCLLVLGFMIAYWGGVEHRMRARLSLLREMTVLNPRLGVHETFVSALEKLRARFDADGCLLLVADGTHREYWLYDVRRDGSARNPVRCPPDKAALLLSPPFTEAMLVDNSRWRSWLGRSVYVEDVLTRQTARTLSPAASVVVNVLDAPSVATVPIRCNHEATGRLYVSGRAGTFDASDLDFLAHAMDATVRVTENVRLVDRLAAEAADNERRRIARGIHQTVIQPFIGLQLGLGAILSRLREGDEDVQPAVERLLSLIDGEVNGLRQYVTVLRGGSDPRLTLVDGMRRFGQQFQNATGIDVYVDGPTELALSEGLATELFEMTAEALSNVRRHTAAHRVAIGLQQTGSSVSLTIENDGVAESAQPFEPRSLFDHAQALGGQLRIRREPGTTLIAITVPV